MNKTYRDLKGRFAALPWRKWERRMIVGVMVVAGVILGGGLLTNNYAFLDRWAASPLTYTAEFVEASEMVTVIRADKLEEMKQDVLKRLEECENPHKKPIVFDSNGVASVGQFQWQPHSFQHYWKKKTGQDITEKEAVLLALDDEKARELARYVIFETDKGSAKDWVNCTKWHDLTTLIKFIKSHE